MGSGIEPPTMQNAKIRKPASVRHSLTLTCSRECQVWQECGKSVARVWQHRRLSHIRVFGLGAPRFLRFEGSRRSGKGQILPRVARFQEC